MATTLLKIAVSLSNSFVFNTDPGNSTVYFGGQINPAIETPPPPVSSPNYNATATVPTLSMVSTNPLWLQITNTTNTTLSNSTSIGNVDLSFPSLGNNFMNIPIYNTDYLTNNSGSVSVPAGSTAITSIEFHFPLTTNFNASSQINGFLVINGTTLVLFTLSSSGNNVATATVSIPVSGGNTITFFLPDLDAYTSTLGTTGNFILTYSPTGETDDIFANKSGFLWMFTDLPPVCLHGGSLIQTPDGLKRMDQLTVNDQVMVPEGIYVSIKEVVQCQLKMPQFKEPHDALILEKDSLAPNVPSSRLIIDPGHPIALPSNPTNLQPAGSYFSNPNYISWTDETMEEPRLTRYDLILEDPYPSYLVHNVVVKSRKTRTDAGYDHRYQGSN